MIFLRKHCIFQTSFYVTESAAFRQQVLYFRQDDWATLCRPLVEQLTKGTFEKLDAVRSTQTSVYLYINVSIQDDARTILCQRKLGFSFVRLLPKETGVRPIVNLRRKFSQRQVCSVLCVLIELRLTCNQSDGSPALSINQVLQAAFQILTYEKVYAMGTCLPL